MRPLFLGPRPSLLPASAARALGFLWSLAPHGLHRRGARQLRLWQGIEARDPALVHRALANGADPTRTVLRSLHPCHPLGEALNQGGRGDDDGLRVLILLLEAGASPDTLLFDRSSPGPGLGEPCLLRALRLAELPCCLALLDRGADPDAPAESASSGREPPVPGEGISARSFAQARLGPHGGPCQEACELFLTELARRASLAQAQQIEAEVGLGANPASPGPGGRL